ncbi:MAG TPA: rRNA maturation RNase YbeY [Mycobacteriales bacterium]|nr:rRNA maturation RNase YbeY [Mycobacteriales bacterium]
MSIEISNESGDRVDEHALAVLARHVLDEMDVNALAELSILLVDTVTMESLHEQWMGEPGPTDVLAFPMDEFDVPRGPDDADPSPTVLGDVVLCPRVAADQAATAGHSAEDELHLLCTHGVLHLLGYDHAEPDQQREMFELQGRLLESWRAGRADRVVPTADAPGAVADTGGDARP